MLGQLLRRRDSPVSELYTSQLFNQDTFYAAFLKDLKNCYSEVIIESPFITDKRVSQLLPVFKKLKGRHVRIVINTRDPEGQDSDYMWQQARQVVPMLQNLDIQVFYTGGHHRKLAVIDRRVIYEGSLNILSQNDSCEIMRRIESTDMAEELIRFVKLNKFLYF